MTSDEPRPFGVTCRVVSARRRIAWTASMCLAMVVLGDCKTTEGCDPNQPCVCTGGTDCYLGCTGDGCSQDCHSVGNFCGTVCQNNCSSVCHDVSNCTSYCGNNCKVTCQNVTSCGAICGDSCNYSCESVAQCGARVGVASTIRCTSVSLCEVECIGACHVTCNNVSQCTVHCLGGGSPMTCPDGMTMACGAC